MIKLKTILFEGETPNIFIPRRMDDRSAREQKLTQQEVNRKVAEFIKNPRKNSVSSSEEDGLDYFSLSNDPSRSPADITLRGDFIVPDILKRVNMTFILANGNVTKLPDNLFVKGDLIISGCKKLKELPKGLIVSETIWAERSGLIEIPNDIKCNIIILQRTPFLNKYVEKYGTKSKIKNALSIDYPNIKIFDGYW